MSNSFSPSCIIVNNMSPILEDENTNYVKEVPCSSQHASYLHIQLKAMYGLHLKYFIKPTVLLLQSDRWLAPQRRGNKELVGGEDFDLSCRRGSSGTAEGEVVAPQIRIFWTLSLSTLYFIQRNFLLVYISDTRNNS